MAKNIGNPFCWGFNEQRAIETLAKRGKAKYNKPMEVVEQKTALENFFEQNVSHSANPAHIVGMTPISPEPYLIPSVSGQSFKDADTPEALIDAIAQGGNVRLTDDIILNTSLNVALDNTDFDLNGKSLTVGDNFGIKVTGQNATISNGTIKVTQHGEEDVNDRAIRIEGVSANIENVTFESELDSFIAVQGISNVGGSINISECLINAPNVKNFAITQNGLYGGTNWVIKNTVINAQNCNGAIYISNSKSADKQNVLIEKCEINAKGCVEVKHSNLTIKDSILKATDEQTYVENGNGNCTTGYTVAMTNNAKDTEISGNMSLINNSYSNVEGGYAVYIHSNELPEGYTLDTTSIKFKD